VALESCLKAWPTGGLRARLAGWRGGTREHIREKSCDRGATTPVGQPRRKTLRSIFETSSEVWERVGGGLFEAVVAVVVVGIHRYIYLYIDSPATIPPMQTAEQKAGARGSSTPGWPGTGPGGVAQRGLCAGTRPGHGRRVLSWTRKVKGKTVCVALSREQYEWLKQAIANWRTVQGVIRQMQRLSREELFEAIPGPKRRKKLGKRVLGLA